MMNPMVLLFAPHQLAAMLARKEELLMRKSSQVFEANHFRSTPV